MTAARRPTRSLPARSRRVLPAALAVAVLATTVAGTPVSAAPATSLSPVSAPVSAPALSASAVSSLARLAPTADLSARIRDAAAARPDAPALALASDPGAPITIWMDIDGAQLTGTWWNSWLDMPAIPITGYDTNRAPGTWTTAETTAIVRAWLGVVEDFAPFAVNITTVEPAAEDLARADSADPRYGVRVIVGDPGAQVRRLCRCQGAAYPDTFGTTAAALAPVLAFPQGTDADTPKDIADTVAHEVAHTLGVGHAGAYAEEAVQPGGIWGPLMGVSNYAALSQWSQRTWPGSTDPRADLDILAASLPLHADDHPTWVPVPGSTRLAPVPTSTSISPAPATPLPARTAVAGLIAGPAPWALYSTGARTGTQLTAGTGGASVDTDVFAFTATSTRVSISAVGQAYARNLDLRVRLVAANGSVLATGAPATRARSRLAVTGADASVSYSRLSPGATYYIVVDGTASGTAPGVGATAYGSIGRYTLTRR